MRFLKWFVRWVRYSLHGGASTIAEIAWHSMWSEFRAMFRFLNISRLTRRAADFRQPCGHSKLEIRQRSTGELYCGVCGESR